MDWQYERRSPVSKISRRTGIGLMLATFATLARPDLVIAKPKTPGDSEPGSPSSEGEEYFELPLILNDPQTKQRVARLTLIHPEGIANPGIGTSRLELEPDVLAKPPYPKTIFFREHLQLIQRLSPTPTNDLVISAGLAYPNPTKDSGWVSTVNQPILSDPHQFEISWTDWKLSEAKWDGTPLVNTFQPR